MSDKTSAGIVLGINALILYALLNIGQIISAIIILIV